MKLFITMDCKINKRGECLPSPLLGERLLRLRTSGPVIFNRFGCSEFVYQESLKHAVTGGIVKLGRRQKKRGARQNHKRLPYNSINLYRTSLDHLLLGMDADIDKMSIAF